MSAAEPAPLRLESIGPHAWRLCDPTVDARDAANVVAYVERGPGGAFEAVWVFGARGTSHHGTMDEVLAHAVSLIADRRRGVRTKPFPIPHRPPSRGR